MADDLPALLRAMADGRAAEADLLRRLADRLDTPAASPTGQWMNLRDAAAHAGIGKSTLWRLVKGGAVPARTVGNRIIINRADLDAYLARQPRPSDTPALTLLTDQRRRERA